MYTADDLITMQYLPFETKIKKSILRIKEWYSFYGGNVCVSISGGKDSTVLLHLVRSVYPDVKAVYCDTRLEYPEVRENALNTDNLVVLKPKMNFREVVEKYGYCYPNKEIARKIADARRGVKYALANFEGKNADGTENRFAKKSTVYWKWLIGVDVKISDKCCAIMKELPFKHFTKETGLYPYIGILACESIRRKAAWLESGCNSYTTGKSKPLSIWLEQDILRYILEYNLKIPSVYGEIINVDGKLKCSGVSRTGCVFCPVAAHLEKPNKFQRLKLSHPKLYDYCMKELGLKEFLDKVGVNYV